MSIDIVIPVYNSEKSLYPLIDKISNILGKRPYKIILVNDNSNDSSLSILIEIANKNGNVKVIDLAKNFGQDSAIMAGLNFVDSELVVIMDDDLQHDPQYITNLENFMIKNNYDICYAFFDKKKQSIIKNFGSWLNDRLANIVLNKPKKIYLSPFKILRRSLVDKIKTYNGPYPYIDGLIFRYTSKINQIPVKHNSRKYGKGNYNLKKSISLWLRVLTSFSIFPLRFSTIIGLFSSFIGFLLGIYFIVIHFIGVDTPEGWPSIIVSVLFIGGIQLM